MTGEHAPERTAVHLELERGTPQIAGAILDVGGGRQLFSGWLELVALLERLRGAPAEHETGDVE